MEDALKILAKADKTQHTEMASTNDLPSACHHYILTTQAMAFVEACNNQSRNLQRQLRENLHPWKTDQDARYDLDPVVFKT